MIAALLFFVSLNLCVVLGGLPDSYFCVVVIIILDIAVTAAITASTVLSAAAALAGAVLFDWVFAGTEQTYGSRVGSFLITVTVMVAVSLVLSFLAKGKNHSARLRAEAEKDKLRADLLCSVSHDVRTPLTTIIGSSQALLENGDKLDDATKTGLITKIKNEAEWLNRVFGNILTLSRLESGDWKPVLPAEPAEEVIAEAISDFRKLCPDVSVSAVIPDEPLMIDMDAVLIKRVLLNLFDNSVTHGKTTSHIELSLKTEGEFAVFTVSDDGQGIPGELEGRLFSGPFVRKNEAVPDGSRSMGLGLSLCKRAVELHGGAIRGFNGESGAVFEFKLPLRVKKN